MARGGKRDGAGRKAGSLTKRTRQVAEGVIGEGQTPLEYMLGVMRDPTKEHALRADMAKAAAPYVHARLAAIEHTGKDGGPLTLEIVRFANKPA
jgi:hypothetical protein